MAKSKANTTAGARPKASRREGRAPAAATAKAETGAAPALPGRSAAPTKQAAVIGLLQREGGATLADLVDATGWLPHTTRRDIARHGIDRLRRAPSPFRPGVGRRAPDGHEEADARERGGRNSSKRLSALRLSDRKSLVAEPSQRSYGLLGFARLRPDQFGPTRLVP